MNIDASLLGTLIETINGNLAYKTYIQEISKQLEYKESNF